MDVPSAIQCFTRLGIFNGAVPDNVSVASAGGRNDNTIVRCDGRAGYVIKAAYPADPAAERALKREADFCAFCAKHSEALGLDDLIPRVAAMDADRNIYVYDLIQLAIPLSSMYESVTVWSEMGTKLARLQRRCTELLADDSTLALSSEPPSVLSIHRPAPQDLSELSAATWDLLSIVQRRSQLCEYLDGIRDTWTATTFIHGDIRATNVLISSGLDEPTRLHFVDFETAAFGDPAWDVAGALQDVAFSWIQSMTANADLPQMTRSASRPFAHIQPAARALVRGYLEAYNSEGSEAEQFIERATRFSAARLLQSAYECAAELDVLPAHAVLLIQLAENIASNPRRAAEGFYGIA